MYQPETEDMLPRMAPKPSGSSIGANEPLVRPQVPEVSILFGQQQATNNMQQHQTQPPTMQQPQQQTTSYAAWKKQMLPKVTFPPSLAMGPEVATSRADAVSSNNNQMQGGLNSVYPLRSQVNQVMPATSTNGYMGNAYSSAPNTNENSNVYMISNGMAGTNPTTYRKSMDNCGVYQPTTQQLQSAYRRSMDMPQIPPNYHSPRDVLTICAGTQTDAMASSPPPLGVPSNIATKQDVDDLKQMVQELRHEQHCLAQLMEKFLCSQFNRTPNTDCKDIGIQVNTEIKEGSPITNGHTPLPAVATNRIVQQLKQSPNVLQTPKGKPMAQSTTYRPNSPQSNRLQEYQQPEAAPAISMPKTQSTTNYPEWSNPQLAALLPKPSTDKSLMMNELALKYLPNEKLAELLKDLNMGCPTQKPIPEAITPAAPLRNIDNFERGPSDISNASYKYLKKYRLLPEDHIEDCENENPREAANCTPAMNVQQQFGTPSRSPIQQRQNAVYATPKACSPYQQQHQLGSAGNRLPQSPLARNDGTPRNNHMLDLENIKHQPKFL
ncbi:uncharacterized protein LOC133325877 [Musca vetustissima]|uniref:uncharacterized protein LOC133325877 n=1 Tax=Musca vetustissima TaxID=27455 RepID=UPI002AB72617|nr:uncharacterized protein LOC133325877 [Musca vetustissima]